MPFPRTKKVILRTLVRGEHSHADGTMLTTTFNLNSATLPSNAQTGVQGLGYDEIAPHYNESIVLAARVTVTFQYSSKSATINIPAMLGMWLYDSILVPVLPATWNQAGAQDGSVFKMMREDGVPTHIGRAVGVKRFFKVSKLRDAEDLIGLEGPAPVAPTQILKCMVFTQARDNASSPGELDFLAVIEQLCLFRVPRYIQPL